MPSISGGTAASSPPFRGIRSPSRHERGGVGVLLRRSTSLYAGVPALSSPGCTVETMCRPSSSAGGRTPRERSIFGRGRTLKVSLHGRDDAPGVWTRRTPTTTTSWTCPMRFRLLKYSLAAWLPPRRRSPTAAPSRIQRWPQSASGMCRAGCDPGPNSVVYQVPE